MSELLTSVKINMGIAMRMAALMRLHREETYALQNPSKEMVIAAESARRTLWMLHSKSPQAYSHRNLFNKLSFRPR